MATISTNKQQVGAKALNTTPGPLKQAARQEYFGRGSLQNVQILHWKIICAVLAFIAAVQAIGFTQLIPLKTVEVITVTKIENGGGRVVSELGKSGWKSDSETTGYFLNAWAELTFDINFSTWKRNVDRSATMVTGTALDQLRELLKKAEFNSASLINDKPAFVRTYETVSVNFIKDDVALIRFKLTSRATPGSTPEIKTFAITTNFIITPPKTQLEALRNPAGIFITSFNLSEEATSK